MRIDYQIISVFSSKKLGFTGNPAAVILLDSFPSREVMQETARELGQPASTFIVRREGANSYNILWFAPDAEIGLCGHGTAAATVFLGLQKPGEGEFKFHYPEGELIGKLNDDQTVTISADAIPVQEELREIPEALKEGLNIPIKAIYKTSNKHILLTDCEDSVRNMDPDFSRLRDCEIFGYAVTAKGDKVDFVSRTLVPHTKQLEDFATGSSHAMLVPFWSKKLNKKVFNSLQLSERGGAFKCALNNGVVELSGEFLVEKEGRTEV